MNILHTVESYYPSVGGMQEVVRQLSERLVKLGHTVTVATSKRSDRKNYIHNGVKIVEFNIKGNAVNGYNAETAEILKYKTFLLTSNFDILTNFAAQQWATDITLPLLSDIKTKKVFVPTGFSALYTPTYHDYFVKMKSWMNQYDMNVFLSHDYQDINFARQNNIRNTTVITNGAAADEFLPENTVNIRQQLGVPSNHLLILHVGSHTGKKGHRESMHIFKKAQIDNVTFLLIGNSFGGIGCTTLCKAEALTSRISQSFKDDSKKLLIKDLGRTETIAAYKEADIFLFPSNIECSPIVLFECMASKTPFLTTDVGNSREIVEWSKSGILLPTIKHQNHNVSAEVHGSARILETICHDAKSRKNMSESGFVAWKEKFTWELIAKQYESLYTRLLCQHNT